MSTNDKIIDRMKKLLAMSQDASSENEALIAAKRLHTLLSKYNMSLSDLESSEDEVGDDRFETINFPYRRRIAQAVARLYYCDMYYIRRYRKNYAKIVLVGKQQHRDIARVIIDQVIKIIDREATKSSLEQCGKRVSNYISSFRNGAAERVVERCLKLIREAKAGNLVDEDTGENLPSLASLYDREKSLVDEFMAGLTLATRRATSRATSAFGMSQGARVGDKVPLHQGLSKTSPKLLN